MREIKFRAWDNEFKRMKVTGMGINNGVLSGDNLVIMQFTGLRDKNGKDIYEGDILKIYDYQDGIEKNCFVEWNDNCAYEMTGMDGQFLGTLFYNTRCLEVIGNIYEHQELVK